MTRRNMGPRVLIGIWILILGCGCVGVARSQEPLGQAPLTVRLDRNWVVPPSAPLGYVVEHVRREHGDGRPLVFGLQTGGPPVPFRIDPTSGIVYVNDTLADKVNQTYSLWVTSTNGDLPNKVEVLAVISDSPGYRPRPPRLPQFPGGSLPDWASFPKPPKTTFTTQRTTEVPTEEATTESKVTVPTLGPPKPPEDLDKNSTMSVDNNDTKEKNVSRDPAAPESDLYIKVVPVAAVAGLVVVGGGAMALLWRRSNGKKAKNKKDDMSKEPSGMVMQDTSLHGWDGPRAFSNRYEAWDNSHLQIPENGVDNEGAGLDDENKEQVRDAWEFPRHRLRVFNIVGEGAFGQVWRAQAIDIDGCVGEVTVAVKTLKENASEKERSDLLQELEVMKGLGSHPNVVRLLACCTDKEPTFLIMEFVQLGKLQSFLRDSRAERHYGNTHGGSNSLTSRDLTHYAYQVARGMHYLSSKGIIHRDLAARNVLITEERTCKVADFGFARDVADTHVYERKSDGRLPIRWMAPESLYDDIFSMKSDIWSFGVLVWEIVTLGSTPYPGLSAADVMRKVRDGYRLEKPEHCRRELYNIMYYCWEVEPAGRPDFDECVTLLERLLCTETDYIELERFPDHSYYNVQHLDGEKL